MTADLQSMVATSIVDWTQKFPAHTGLDQLGMRLASEDQYTQLVDYTTTVTWHPRYYSFLAWATRSAIRLASGAKGVERRTWQRTMRRLDYQLAAATLADSPSALAIIGSDKLRGRIERAAKVGAQWTSRTITSVMAVVREVSKSTADRWKPLGQLRRRTESMARLRLASDSPTPSNSASLRADGTARWA